MSNTFTVIGFDGYCVFPRNNKLGQKKEKKREAVIKNHKEQLALIKEYKSYLAEIQQKGVENLTYFEKQYIVRKVETVDRELAKKEAEGRLLKIQLDELTDRLEVA